MRIPLRSLAVVLSVVGIATCSDTPNVAPIRVTARGVAGKGVLSLTPAFSAAAAAVFAQRAAFADANFDRVRVAIIRPPADTLTDTTVVFTPSSPDLTLDLTVNLLEANETFAGIIQYLNAGGVVFNGHFDKLVAHAPDDPTPPQPTVVLDYVGPGFDAARIVVAPKTPIITAPAVATFSATVFDAKDAPIANVPVVWTTSDPSIATISNAGVLTTSAGRRGTVVVTARTLTKLSDSARATITLPAAGISVVSGGGQTGKAGAALAQPAVVRVAATDGVGIAGVAVSFSASGGGRVGASSVTTDANGAASTTLTLGTTAGPQTFSASAAGFSASISATVLAGDPAGIVAVSGGGQSDTAARLLKNPLVAKVSDSFGNAVAGATVSWARTAGTGSLSATTSTSNAAGLASVGYTLGGSAGNETITASVSGVGTPASFTVEALPSVTPTIALSSTSLAFTGAQGGLSPASKSIVITNGGSGTLSDLSVGAVTYATGASGWLQAPTLSAASASPSATLTVQPAIAGLLVGSYSATIPVISSVATNSPQSIAVTFVVTPGAQVLSVSGGGTGTGVVTSSPAGIACTVSNGATSGTCVFGFTFGTTVTLTGTPSDGRSAFSGWSGASCTGTGSCSLTMNQTRSATANFAPTPPRIVLSTNHVVFSMAQCDAYPGNQFVAVTNGGGGILSDLSVSVIQDNIQTPRGSFNTTTANPSATLSIGVTTSDAFQATFAAIFGIQSSVASNSPVSLPVDLVVSAPHPVLAVSPTSLSFTATQGGANPAAQTVSIRNSSNHGTPGQPGCEFVGPNGPAVGAISYGAGSGWLTAGTPGAFTPSTFSVQPVTGNLPRGTYTASFQVSANTATNGPQTVSVTFTVQ